MTARLMLFNVAVTFPQLFLYPDNCLSLLRDYCVMLLFFSENRHMRKVGLTFQLWFLGREHS